MAAEDFVKAVTLLEYQQAMDQNTLAAAIMDTWVRESDVMSAIPIVPAKGGKFTGWAESQLPEVRNRAFNEDGNVSKGRVEKFEEGVFLMDEFIKVDRAMLDLNGDGERARQENMKVKSMSRHGTRVILKGDNAAEPREASGLQVRAGWGIQTQIANSPASGGGPLSLQQLDRAINETRNPSHIIMDRTMQPVLAAAARSPTLTNTMFGNEQDPLGRKVMTYQGLPILFGYPKSRDASILPFSEVGAGGGAAVTSSIYVVNFNGDDGVFMIEGTPLSAVDEGKIPGTVLHSTHVKWDWGLFSREFAITRLSSITAGAIVA